MKQVRLLPIVIAAGVALLLLKGLGIMTGGGYVLTGPAFAAGGGAPAAAAGGDATMSMPVEPTLVDESPVLDDGAPTLPLADKSAGGHGGPAAGVDHAGGEDPPHETDSGEAEPAHAEAVPALSESGDQAPEGGEHEVAEVACPEGEQSVLFSNPDGDCGPPVDATGDAVPMETDDAGYPVPVVEADTAGAGSENDVLERLAQRREQLDAREAELDMRLALIEAAELRIQERTAALEVLEARINALVDEKRVLEEAQFTSLIAMYETMKPKEAAAIFDELDAQVLLRVARAVSPRKMGPIMAKMNPVKAMELTAGLAIDRVEPTIDMAQEDLASLPQIVGQ